MGQFRRDISPNERLYLAGETLAPPFAIQIFVEGRGAIDDHALRSAVVADSTRCPGAALVAHRGHWVDGGLHPRVRRVVGRVGPDFDVGFLRDRLDPHHGPTCEVVVVEDLDLTGRTTLVFRALHGVMDGQGVLTWMADVFRLLRGEPAQRVQSQQTDLGLLRALGSPHRRSGFSFSTQSPLGSGPVIDTEFLWRRRTLGVGHAGMVARLAAILAEQAPARLMVPVDLRRHLPALSTTGNLSLPIFLDAARGEPWQALHQRLLAALAARQELATDGSERAIGAIPLPGLRGLMRGIIEVQRRTQKYSASAILSHLGRIAPAEFSAGSFVAETLYSLPVHAIFCPLALVAIECGEHLELTVAAAQGGLAAERVTALLDRVEDCLGQTDPRRWTANRTHVAYPVTTVVDQFVDQAGRTPQAVAVIAGERELTYAELLRRAQAAAQALRSRGIERGDVVGLLAERTVEALVAMWGILLADAAFLPIDPLNPDPRIALLLVEGRARLCLGHRRHLDRLAGTACDLLALEDVPVDWVPPQPIGSSRAQATDLAYVIFTSGSTGRPKGVQIEHGALANYLRWAKTAYRVDPQTRFGLFTSLAVDLSITSVFVPLIAGGQVELYSDEVDHLLLGQVLEHSGANALKLTPSHLELILTLGFHPRGFRTLVVGGEQLRGRVADRTRQLFGAGCDIVNEYGPTETTVGCIAHVFDPDRDREGVVPIGVPIANTRIYLLDPNRAPVGPGETGEIYIAGAGLARGYVGGDDPRFVQLADGERAYRSGDLARINEDGLLDCLGRADDQLKIRGHRVEPAEIAATLERYPGVLQAVVTGRPHLCAYVVMHAGHPLDLGEATRFLADHLPSHMVPHHLIAVDRFTLTGAGKIDIHALPAPLDVPTAATEAGNDDLRQAVAAIWAEILVTDAARVVAGGDFYRLGGDSLKMIAMVASVARRVVGKTYEAAFTRHMRPLLGHATLDEVCAAVASSQVPTE